MTRILTLEQIQEALPALNLMEHIEAGFVAYSQGAAVVPPVGELVLQDPPGDVHIKYGYLSGDDYYVIKIASGFYDNPKLNLPTSNGLMLLFSQKTGELHAVLLDKGYLTDIRTAIAGAIAAKFLAPSTVTRIGIVGSGMQARLQLQHLAPVTDCRDVIVFGRDDAKLSEYREDMAEFGFDTTITSNADDILRSCNLIVTTTPATDPLLAWSDGIEHGLHITAMGSDTPDKRELDLTTMQCADVVVADSISQCMTRGEIHHAIKQGAIRKDDIVELGNVIDGSAAGRTSDEQVTIADLTGVAVQDIQITKAVFDAISKDSQPAALLPGTM